MSSISTNKKLDVHRFKDFLPTDICSICHQNLGADESIPDDNKPTAPSQTDNENIPWIVVHEEGKQHPFHEECLKESLNKWGKKCPCCQTPINVNSIDFLHLSQTQQATKLFTSHAFRGFLLQALPIVTSLTYAIPEKNLALYALALLQTIQYPLCDKLPMLGLGVVGQALGVLGWTTGRKIVIITEIARPLIALGGMRIIGKEIIERLCTNSKANALHKGLSTGMVFQIVLSETLAQSLVTTAAHPIATFFSVSLTSSLMSAVVAGALAVKEHFQLDMTTTLAVLRSSFTLSSISDD
jgi:hypothetical protein